MTSTTTHALIAYLASLFITKNKRLQGTAVFGALFADFDAIPAIFDYGLYRQIHRVWFHSVFMSIIFGLIVSAVYCLLKRDRKSFKEVFLFFNLGYLLHLGEDFLLYGSMNILSPFGFYRTGINLFQNNFSVLIAFDAIATIILSGIMLWKLKKAKNNYLLTS